MKRVVTKNMAHSFRSRLTLLILIVVGIILTGVLTFATMDTLFITQKEYQILENATENNAVILAGLTDRGLSLEDARFDPFMEKGLRKIEAEYTETGGDITRVDLDTWKSRLSREFEGQVDLYIISDEGRIIRSTVPEVLGLDFSRTPEFYTALNLVREGSSFRADRLEASWRSSDAEGVHGTFRKFAYLPTTDHAYVLEMGITSKALEETRKELSYQVMADELKEDNHLITSVRIFDIYKNPLAITGTPESATPEKDLKKALDTVLITKSTLEFRNPAGDQVTRFQYVNLTDSRTVTNPSIVLETTYRSIPVSGVILLVLWRYLAIGLVSVIIGAVIAFLASSRLSGEMSRIVGDVNSIARGDLEHRIEKTDTQEFQFLAESINRMVKRIRADSAQIENERTERQIAARIQRAFLPRDNPCISGFELSYITIPARDVGGDFYDFFRLQDGRYAIVIADVSGKGLPASLFMAFSRTILRTVSRQSGEVQRIISDSNQEFFSGSDEVSFVTLFLGILDPGQKVLSYTNAGHNPPLLLRAGGDLEKLIPTGPAIGIDDTAQYSGERTVLGPGDLLVLFTDGVTEATDTEGAFFGDGRLECLVADLAGLPADEVIRRIHNEVSSFTGGAVQSDDITIMALVSRPSP